MFGTFSEVEYAKNLSRLAASVKPALTEEVIFNLLSNKCNVFTFI